MAKYHNPKTGKTVEAKNLKEALIKFKPKSIIKPKPKPKPKPKKKTEDD